MMQQEQQQGPRGPQMVPPVLDGGRILGLRPARAVTQQEIDTFWRDGVVKLEQILPLSAADYLRDCFEDIFFGYEGTDNPEKTKAKLPGLKQRITSDLSGLAEKMLASGGGDHLLVDGGYKEGQTRFTGRVRSEVSVFNWHTDFNRWASEGPLPEAVSQLLGSRTIQYYNDQLFYKEAGSLLRTGFHQDAAAFPVRGEQVAICWVPCDIVTKDSGAMCYIRGSHRWRDKQTGKVGMVYQMSNLVTDKKSGAQPVAEAYEARTGVPPLPDIEGHEEDYDIIYVEARPGDVIVHHNLTVHGSHGNTSSERHRRAASVRYIGDDVVFDFGERAAMAPVAYSSPTKDSPAARKVLAQQAPAKQAGAGAGRGTLQVFNQLSSNRTPGEPLSGPEFPVVWPRPPTSARL